MNAGVPLLKGQLGQGIECVKGEVGAGKAHSGYGDDRWRRLEGNLLYLDRMGSAGEPGSRPADLWDTIINDE